MSNKKSNFDISFTQTLEMKEISYEIKEEQERKMRLEDRKKVYKFETELLTSEQKLFFVAQKKILN